MLKAQSSTSKPFLFLKTASEPITGRGNCKSCVPSAKSWGRILFKITLPLVGRALRIRALFKPISISKTANKSIWRRFNHKSSVPHEYVKEELIYKPTFSLGGRALRIFALFRSSWLPVQKCLPFSYAHFIKGKCSFLN